MNLLICHFCKRSIESLQKTYYCPLKDNRQVDDSGGQLSGNTLFVVAAAEITVVLGAAIAAIHHIGSTAIPGIYAKPIIDILVEVSDLAQVDARNAAMETLGYEAMGEFGIAGRRFFRKHSSKGIRTHHVHIFEQGSSESDRHLAFRDYMIAHPNEAEQYSQLKRSLANKDPNDIDRYMDGKDSFIREKERQALEWRDPLFLPS